MPRIGSGIIKRGATYRIDKRTPWGRLREDTGTGDRREAEAILAARLARLREVHILGAHVEHTFAEAAGQHLLRKRDLRSIRDVARSLDVLVARIGEVPVRHVHQATLDPLIADLRRKGLKAASINYLMANCRAVLTTAARVLRDGDRPWLDTVPLLQMLPTTDAARAYPLSWDEQTRLLAALPGHLATMALYALHTGCREGEICSLRWEWEHRFDGTSVFVIPGAWTKNGHDSMVVCNSVAQSIVDGERGKHPTHVFQYRGRPLRRMHSHGWRVAWERAGLPVEPEWKRGPHNLRHTVGRRLRAAGVSEATRRSILHHGTRGDVHERYAPADLREIRDALELLVTVRPERATLLRAVRSA